MTDHATGEWGVHLGIYEKALLPGSVESLFTSAAQSGFSFVDLSIDESPERLARLSWPSHRRDQVRNAARDAGVEIGGLCLSAHRTIAPGSADPAQREAARTLLVDAIDLARDLGAPVVQIAGYYAHYEAPRPGARDDYIDVLTAGTRHAARRGVALGIENVEGTDIVSVQAAMAVVDAIGSPWFALYPDIGNFVVQSRDVVSEMRASMGHALAWHVKDARPGEPRRVPMGGGDVPWDAAFTELARQRWSGRVMVEMWNDDNDANQIAAQAGAFIAERMNAAGIPIHGRKPIPATDRKDTRG